MKASLLLAVILNLLYFNLSGQVVTTLTNVTANGGVWVTPDESLLVAHFGPLPIIPSEAGTDILRITPDGDVTTFAENVVLVGTGTTMDSEGFVYQGSFLGGVVVKINPDGEVVNDSFAVVAGPVGVTTIANDTVLVCSCSTNSVLKVAQDGATKVFVSGTPFACANGITKDDEGNIYTTNFADPRITRISPSGEATTLGQTQAGNGHLVYRPNDGKLYIASYGGHQIFSIDLAGNVTLFAGTGEAGALDSENPLEATFSKPNGIAISGDGCSLYITQDENVIREIKFSDGNCTTSVEVLEDNTLFDISPNPVNSHITFTNHSGIAVRQIQFISTDGTTVKSVTNPEARISIEEIRSGLYYMHITDRDGSRFVKKIVVR